MAVFYFNGNKTRGIDLTSILEDISINMQKKKALRQARFKVDIFKYKSLQECIDFANNADYACLMVQPNQKAIEGEHEDRLYYLHKYVIKWCRKRSLKALLIRLVGVDIDCPNRQ
jgi:hypothetical protein